MNAFHVAAVFALIALLCAYAGIRRSSSADRPAGTAAELLRTGVPMVNTEELSRRQAEAEQRCLMTGHGAVHDITTMSDVDRQLMCGRCGWTWAEPR